MIKQIFMLAIVTLITSFSVHAAKSYSYACHSDSANYQTYTCTGANIVPTTHETRTISVKGGRHSDIHSACVSNFHYSAKQELKKSSSVIECFLSQHDGNKVSTQCTNHLLGTTRHLNIVKITCQKTE